LAAVDSVGAQIKAGGFAPLADLLQGNNTPTVVPPAAKVP
jgi:hypothetical protein